ncbi:MAG: nuclear transport factor 2 family protein [Microlunatus sp.]|nr:nuclear transport factor 2 family protein [Microlunatus sp.]MDN5769650.1 nuclear transport factor 2 family protein [Microlunatus sp.]MDN5803539.1 nuclear transport factor 2 family protein [Microlunatus sp.]
MTNLAQQFADRLTELEASGDVDSFVSAVFADDTELVRPETRQQLTDHDGAHRFWTEYLSQFTKVQSTFNRVHYSDIGVLEWTSSAQLAHGTDITYAGVSLLDFNDQGQVSRFCTYYDTRVFQPNPGS